ncbi:MAG: phosphoribosylformylglycinamidine synthase subunit PurL [Crenarchaeota archaeon]|nr:phosphoribosylformylglycinamidine synthase subunit PurL [Thermoproteota archaeon]
MPLSREDIEEIRRILGREPTREELAMFEAQWSEHCSYRSSRRLLKLLPEEGSRTRVLVGRGRDAPAIELFPGVAIVFKIESHNHPSAVDPYNGAATGIGGIVRDVLTLGAKPIALLDMLYLGDPRNPHANWIARGVVKGISDYGNRIGVPTVAGDTWFDPAFNKQPLVNVACVGIVDTKTLASVLRGPREGDLVLIAGNPTGRDGLLGSSFASKPLEDSDSDIAAVQVGDPLMEKLLIDAVTEIARRGLAKLIKDLGGGGLTTAISEVAADHNLGVELHLDALHTRQELTPLEILVSESQERMLLVVDESSLPEVEKILRRYEVPYSIIGRFDGSGRIRAFFKGRLVADVPARELAKPRTLYREARPPIEALKGIAPPPPVREPEDLAKAALKVLSSPNIASKRWIYEQYDHEVGIRTVLKPGYGDAAVLRLLDGSGRGLAVKGDANPRYTSLNPFSGAANSVAECFRNLVATGAQPLAIVDEINAGNPEKPHHYWFFDQMVKGVAWMASELDLPVVGGKVSFYNEDASGRQVKPTATIVGVGRIDNVERALPACFSQPRNLIAIVGVTYPELGGSEYLYAVHGIEAGEVPRPRPASELRAASLVLDLASRGAIASAHDIGSGGLATAILEACVCSGLGASVDLDMVPSRGIERLDQLLFSETQARYIIEVPREALPTLERLARERGARVAVIGEVRDSGEVELRSGGKRIASIGLEEAREAYESSLPRALEW